MSLKSQTSGAISPDRLGPILLLALLLLLGLFPPETRGESMAGCAALICIAVFRYGLPRTDLRFGFPIVLIGALTVPWLALSRAPGSAPEPLAMACLALAAGWAVTGLPLDVRRRRWLFDGLAVIGALVALHALYQWAWGLDALERWLESGQGVADQAAVLERARAGRAFAAFPTPAALGGYLALLLPPTVAAGLGRQGRARAALLGLAALQGLGLMATVSGTAVLALVLALVLAALRARAGRTYGLAAVGLVLVVLAGVLFLRADEVFSADNRRSPWVMRADNFRLAGRVIADQPWIGVGPGSFGEVYPAYRRVGDNESRHAHNLPLELGAEMGLPLGLLTSAAFFLLFLGPLLRSHGRDPPAWIGLRIGLAAFAIQNLADFTAFLPSLLWTAALLRGWIAREQAGSERARFPAWHGAALAVIALAAVTAALGGLGWNARIASRQALALGEIEEARSLARRAVALCPWNVDGRMLRIAPHDPATWLRSSTLHEELDRLVALCPVRPSIRRYRARYRGLVGDLPGAYADAAEAARLYPANPDYAAERERLRLALDAAGKDAEP